MPTQTDPKRVYQSHDAAPAVLYAKRDQDSENAYPIAFGLGLAPYDYVSRVLTDSVTETYTFKTGGASGTTVGTIIVVYTDSTLATISSAERT